MIIDLLSVFSANLEGLGDEIRHVFSNEKIWVDVGGIDLFAEIFDNKKS